MNFLDPRLPDRFWDKVIPEPMSGCWLWVGGWGGHYGECGSAYGVFRVGKLALPLGKEPVTAHRVTYHVLIGHVPEGKELDHKCRVRCCCNPVHLEPVTPRENGLRGKGVAAENARSETCPRRHPYDAVRFRDDLPRRICSACVREQTNAASLRWRRARKLRELASAS